MKRNVLFLFLLLPAQLLLAQNKTVAKTAPLPDSTVKMLSYDEHGRESVVRTKPAMATESRVINAPGANRLLPGKTATSPAAATGSLPAANAVKTTAVAKTVTVTPVKKAAANTPAVQAMPVLQTDPPRQVNQ